MFEFFSTPADHVRPDLEEGADTRDRKNGNRDERPRGEEVEEGHHRRIPHTEAPRARREVSERAARAAYRLREHHLSIHHLRIPEHLTEEPHDRVVHKEPREAERRERQKHDIKDAEAAVADVRAFRKHVHANEHHEHEECKEDDIPDILVDGADHTKGV